MANLKVNILGMEFKNPIMTATGPGARDADLILKAVSLGLGGICTKTVSEKFRKSGRCSKTMYGTN